MNELYYLAKWNKDQKYIYCNDNTFKQWLECYKDWNKVKVGSHKDTWELRENIQKDNEPDTDYSVMSLSQRSIYLLIQITETEEDCEYTLLKKIYAKSFFAAEDYVKKLSKGQFLCHISDAKRYELTEKNINSLELEIAN